MALCFPTLLLSLHPQRARISSRPRRWLSASLRVAKCAIMAKQSEQPREVSLFASLVHSLLVGLHLTDVHDLVITPETVESHRPVWTSLIYITVSYNTVSSQYPGESVDHSFDSLWRRADDYSFKNKKRKLIKNCKDSIWQIEFEWLYCSNHH